MRLAAGYRKVGDARKGPLRGWKGGAGPGEAGEVVDVQDRLVQVCVCMCVCARARTCAGMYVCVCACVRACVPLYQCARRADRPARICIYMCAS